jgi:S-ribosylhomocysteine lyase
MVGPYPTVEDEDLVNQPRMNVESFNLDHRTVAAPYIRLADLKVLPAGDVISKYDIRFTQPNVAHLEMPTVHSLEHLFAEHSRNHSDRVIDFSPMGCQTGFYLILQGRWEDAEVAELVAATLTDITTATEVPAANEVQCGWGANHTLAGAQGAAQEFLARRAEWSQVTA